MKWIVTFTSMLGSWKNNNRKGWVQISWKVPGASE